MRNRLALSYHIGNTIHCLNLSPVLFDIRRVTLVEICDVYKKKKEHIYLYSEMLVQLNRWTVFSRNMTCFLWEQIYLAKNSLKWAGLLLIFYPHWNVLSSSFTLRRPIRLFIFTIDSLLPPWTFYSPPLLFFFTHEI